jgi:hypothetical protein
MRFVITLTVIALSLLSGCASTKPPIGKHTGFYALPFPSNAYSPGQIIELWDDRPRVDIVHIPSAIKSLPLIESEGWSISSTEFESIRSAFAAQVKAILGATANYSGSSRVNIELTETKTRQLPIDQMYSAVKQSLATESDLKEMIMKYRKRYDGRYFVLTQTLSARVTFSVIGENNLTVDISADLAKKFESQLNAKVDRTSGAQQVVVGNVLVVGIQFDEEMIQVLLPKQ